MTSRDIFSDLSSPSPSGTQFLAQYGALLDALFDASVLPLNTVGGTGDVVTASVDPALPAEGLVPGMKFTIIWAAENTGEVTLNIDGVGAVPVLGSDGSALTAGALVSDQLDMLEYVSGGFRRLAGGSGSGSVIYDYQEFPASGDWIKPSGLDDDRLVLVRLWGAGSGGASSYPGGGGGGGGYREALLRAGDLPSTVPVTVGAGGAIAARGGSTTFGTIMTAYAGGRTIGTRGAGGAGTNEGGHDGDSTNAGDGGYLGGGDGGGPGNDGANASSEDGGGGGGGSDGLSTPAGDGGRAVNGGGGGGGSDNNGNGQGGESLNGGNGGAAGQAGEVPGGGGGRNAAGARGHAIVVII